MGKETQIERRFTYQEAWIYIKKVIVDGFEYETETLENTKMLVVIMPHKIDKILIDEMKDDDT